MARLDPNRDRYDVRSLLAIPASGRNPDGTVFAASFVEQAAREGRAFVASTGRTTLSVAGNFRATLTNPAGSGRNLLVYRWSSMATNVGFARIRVNPTTGLPATVRPSSAQLVGGAAAVGVLRSDTDATVALAGGTDTGIDIGIPPNGRTVLDFPPMIVPPGNLLGVNVPFTGAADSVLTLYWVEEAV
jgi:hypothetical protein